MITFAKRSKSIHYKDFILLDVHPVRNSGFRNGGFAT